MDIKLNHAAFVVPDFNPQLFDHYKVEEVLTALETRSTYPGCPPGEAEAIAQHACEKYSGRVGRSSGAIRFTIALYMGRKLACSGAAI